MFKHVLLPIFIVLGITAILVALLNLEYDGSISEADYYEKVCMESVVYYQTGYKLAPAVDAETLTFIRCEVK